MSFWRKRYRKRNYQFNKNKTSILQTHPKCMIPKTLSKESCINHFFKRMSRIFSLNQNPKGSMTIETAFVLPLFLFTVITLLSFVEIMRVQGIVTMILHQEVKEFAEYGYVYEKLSTGAISGEILSEMATSFQVVDKIEKEIKKNSFSKAVLPHGVICAKAGMMEEDFMDVVILYKMSPVFSVIPLKNITYGNRCRMRAWTGYDVTKNNNEDSKEKIVYITETGTKYHNDRNCSHLLLSITPCSLNQVDQLRNEAGAKYYPCEECIKGKETTVYITQTGNRFHNSITCSGLKRTIRAVPISKVNGRTPCQRCGE